MYLGGTLLFSTESKIIIRVAGVFWSKKNYFNFSLCFYAISNNFRRKTNFILRVGGFFLVKNLISWFLRGNKAK